MALVTPRVYPPIAPPPPGVRFNAIGFVPNDASGLNVTLPLVVANGVTLYSNEIAVIGFRSFSVPVQLSAGSIKFKPVLLKPDLTVVSEDWFKTLVVGDGLHPCSWGALAGNGGGGSAIFEGGLDGRIYTHMKLGFEGTGGAGGTVSRVDGLWLGSV